MPKKPEIEARVLSPSEYPPSLMQTRGVLFAAQHPLGLYHVEDHGAGVHAVFFTPRRAKRAKVIANARSMPGAFCAISQHEDELVHPEAEREEGKKGPVSIYALGQRTGEPKPKTQLDRELDAWLAEHGYAS